MRLSRKAMMLALVGSASALGASAQGAVDIYNLSRHDMRGTARFMSMGGAFTALGGDISTLTQNPAGIGVYRSSEVALTLDLDFQKSQTEAQGSVADMTNTRFNLNNAGYVGTVRLQNSDLQTISWGISYARTASLNRQYRGRIGNLASASLSNYVAAMTNAASILPQDMIAGNNYSPYLDSNYGWLDILSYNGFVTNSPGFMGSDQQSPWAPDVPNYQGLSGTDTNGSASFEVQEKGYVDEYNITIGGNVSNVVYWGLGLGVTDINYTAVSAYAESLDDAYIAAEVHNTGEYEIARGTADYTLNNYLNSSGSGFNLKFGLIFKPINELRLGIAVHTPTWYQMTDTYWGGINYDYRPYDNVTYTSRLAGTAETNDGYNGYNDYNMRTPWRLMVGAAGVIGSYGIISVDYEYRGNHTMQVSDVNGYAYEDVTSDVKTYYKGTNIVRIGAELRVTPQLSLRAGYSYESSPVTQQTMNDGEFIWTAGTNPAYTLDKHTQYVTAGLGYRSGSFYADLAYVNRQRESIYHAFTPLIENSAILQHSPSARLTDTRNQVVLTLGYKF